jgi:hypothetical protein
MIGLLLMSAGWKEIICSNIPRLMKRDKLSGVEVAAALEKTSSDVSRWVNHASCPSLRTLELMQERLGWTIQDLTWDSRSGKPEPKASRPSKPSHEMRVIEALKIVRKEFGIHITPRDPKKPKDE